MSLESAARLALEVLEKLHGRCSEDGANEEVTIWAPEAIEALRAALAEAQADAEPYAYLVVQEQGYIVGAWKDRETAEKIAAQQLARDSESVVEVYVRPARETQADAEPVAWPCDVDEVDFGTNTLTLTMRCNDYRINAGIHYLMPSPPRRESEPRRKPCTCHDTSRGPGRPCTVKASGALGELWQCVEEPRRESAELSDEHLRALRESHMYDSEQRYFEPRPIEDGAMQRKAFYAGFERGWDAARAVLRASMGPRNPCGECHLQPGERCDVCGATAGGKG